MRKTIARIVQSGPVDDVQYGSSGECDLVSLKNFECFDAIPDPYTYDPWDGINDFTTYIPAVEVPTSAKKQGDTYEDCELYVTVEFVKDCDVPKPDRTAEQAAALLRAEMAFEHMRDAGLRALSALGDSGCEDMQHETYALMDALLMLAHRIDCEKGVDDPEGSSKDGGDD